jgi:5-methyltetrahydropteroyltriglutamate--homocysteine methyltransferase
MNFIHLSLKTCRLIHAWPMPTLPAIDIHSHIAMSTSSTPVHTLGYPRIGAHRELKFALEAFWRGDSSEADLLQAVRTLRHARWQAQQQAGLHLVNVGDLALYDPMLSQTVLLGAWPSRFNFGSGSGSGASTEGATLNLTQQFALARGHATQAAMEMTKWFDTNYHYLVPELDSHTRFTPHAHALLAELREAQDLGLNAKPVLIGPLTWLYLGKSHEAGFERLSLMPALAQALATVIRQLAEAGARWIQLDEPALALDLPPTWRAAAREAYDTLAQALPANARCKLLVSTSHASVAEHAHELAPWPVHGWHIDLVRAPEQLAPWLAALRDDQVLSVGVVDGRNIWRHDLAATLPGLVKLRDTLGERLWLAPSCSLAHVPVSLAHEASLDAEIASWLAFADEKLAELRTLALALQHGPAHPDVQPALQAASQAVASRRASKRVHNALVQKQLAAITPAMAQRHSPYVQRAATQQEALQLPLLPTTTIGSFPQTPAIRQVRAAFKRRELKALDYLQAMRAEVADMVARQEALGLDVLVHGEPERNDMVEYFGEQLWGYAFTTHGWVQSYGSRCVKPPIIYGDIYRPEAITVEMARYAQSLTNKPMKGMLTGPVTMLQWSFVRDDQPRRTTALQLALAIRAEVADLERAGIRIIQIDEPALREGLPLKQKDWAAYLDWAVQAFKLSSCTVKDETQIHTHMCYSEFNDILPSIAAMDADVITIETSRSAMKLLDGFGDFAYPNDIGPGVYDIHSPRVPGTDSMVRLLRRACEVIAPQRLWVNPDCGLKTRAWPETEAALRHMVEAALVLREELSATQQASRTHPQAA